MPPLPFAPQWSLLVGTLGRGLVVAAIALFVLSIIGWARGEERRLGASVGKWAFTLGSFALFGVFACLATLFLTNQFQYEYVFGHAEADLATKYKIAAIWSGQQGSFLLWACCSAIFGLIAGKSTGKYRRWFTIPYALFLACISGILAYETPFNIIPEAIQNGKVLLPPTGNGLTPALQNYWVVIHPPIIFLGFGSLTVLFCWALSAMITRDATTWVRQVRPWSILSLAVLGLGLCLGGFWAYETLGWGGFWAWDPVENVSFVPWVFTAALVHGLIVQATRGRSVGANLLLGGLPFILFVYGTFLTRSGFLGDSSVHSFAEMNRSALWILLGFLVLTAIAFVGVWIKNGRALAREIQKSETETGPNREALYRTGIVLLCAIATATALGMSAPIFSLIAQGRNSRIEEWLYHQVLSYMFIPTMLLIGLAPFATWRSLTWKALLTRVVNIFTLSIGLTGFALLVFRHPEWGVSLDPNKTTSFAGLVEVKTVFWIAFLIFLTLFAAIANIWRMVESLRKSPMSIGGFISHIGLAVFMAGMILSRGFERNEKLFVQLSRPGQGLGYTFKLDKNPDPDKLYDRDNKLPITVTGPDKEFTAYPGLYYTDSAEGPKPMVWPHIERFATHDVYIALGGPQINFWDKPEMFKPGETKTVQDVTVTYHKMEMEGQPGQAGTKFVAHLTVAYEGHSYDVNPSLQITDNGLSPSMPAAGNEFLAAIGRMDAATQGAEIQLFYREALYPIDLYYKPMTSLVWAGAGILTIGGLIAAFYRRVRHTAESTEEVEVEGAPNKPQKDALIPVS